MSFMLLLLMYLHKGITHCSTYKYTFASSNLSDLWVLRNAAEHGGTQVHVLWLVSNLILSISHYLYMEQHKLFLCLPTVSKEAKPT